MPEHGGKNGARRNVALRRSRARPAVTSPSAAVSKRLRAKGASVASSCPAGRGGCLGGGYRGYFNRQDSPPKLIFTPARTVKGSAGIAERFAVMLAQQILHIGVGRERSRDLVAAAEFKALVRAIKVAVGQQQAIAELRIGEKVAVIAPANQGTGKCSIPLRLIIGKSEIAGVGSATERPCADQRRKGADRYVGKVAGCKLGRDSLENDCCTSASR